MSTDRPADGNDATGAPADETDREAGGPPSNSQWSIITQRLHLDNALFWSVAFVFYLAGRLLLVVNFNTSSALTLLSNGTAAVLLGTLITTFPSLPAVGCLVAFYRWVHARHTGTAVVAPLVWVAVAYLVAFFFAIWWVTVVVLSLPILEVILNGRPLSRNLRKDTLFGFGSLPESNRHSPDKLVGRATGIAVLAALYALFTALPWLSQENLIVSGMVGERSAFVVDIGPDWSTFLATDYQIAYVRTSAIIFRTNCRPKHVYEQRSLFLWLTRQTSEEPSVVCVSRRM